MKQKQKRPGGIPAVFVEWGDILEYLSLGIYSLGIELLFAVDVFEEGFDGGFELEVYAFDDGLGSVINADVGFELAVLKEAAFGCAVADNGDAVDERGVLHGHPVDRGHCAGDRHTYEFADVLMFIHPGGAVGVGVAGFAHHHH